MRITHRLFLIRTGRKHHVAVRRLREEIIYDELAFSYRDPAGTRCDVSHIE
jgi:hypothetical protein